jgi:hypothetical protein
MTGMRMFDDNRRAMVNNGMKLRRIVHELSRRGESEPDCEMCRLTGSESYLP